MQEIRTKRLFLRPFMESDNDDLFEFLSQLKDDEFEGYPGINYENGRKISDRTSGSAGTKTARLSGRIRWYTRSWMTRRCGKEAWKQALTYLKNPFRTGAFERIDNGAGISVFLKFCPYPIEQESGLFLGLSSCILMPGPRKGP
ncbi:MAG: hypothetical protein IKI84_03165 [Clostridia bacterium]|nr:hypothetical protein [Clostridia bacterium]